MRLYWQTWLMIGGAANVCKGGNASASRECVQRRQRLRNAQANAQPLNSQDLAIHFPVLVEATTGHGPVLLFF